MKTDEFLESWQKGCLHHAWLLAGPKGSGKSDFAWRMAHFLLAKNNRHAADDSNLFNEEKNLSDYNIKENNSVSALIDARTHPDLYSIEEDNDDSQSLSVNHVRKAIKFLQSAPAMTKNCRVLIIDPIDALNHIATNALLKSLEEPTPGTVIFLISHMPDFVQDTIQSRCRIVTFNASSITRERFRLDDENIKSFINHFNEIKETLPNENREKIHLLAKTVKEKTAIAAHCFSCFEWLWRSMLIMAVRCNLDADLTLPDLSLCLPDHCRLNSDTAFRLWDSAEEKFTETRLASGLDRGSVIRAVFAELNLSLEKD